MPAEGGYDAELLKQGLALRAARATVSARRALEQGFTTIRDVETEGAGYGDVGIKQAIERGYIPGPRMFVVTRAISTTGGYPLEGYAPELDMPKGAQLIDGPVEARKAAREQLSNGADWIKVYMTHRSWVGRARRARLAADADRRGAQGGRGRGPRLGQARSPATPTAASASTAALDGGCDSIEHGLDLDDAAVAQMVRQGTWLLPDDEPSTTTSGRRRARPTATATASAPRCTARPCGAR